MSTEKTFVRHITCFAADPFGQRFRVDLSKHRGIFQLPPSSELGPACVGWLLQDLDRLWWGIFALPRTAERFGEVTLTDAPICITDMPICTTEHGA